MRPLIEPKTEPGVLLQPPTIALMGVTAKGNPWREILVPSLVRLGIDEQAIFDPRVAVWDEAAQQQETQVWATAQLVVFYLGYTGVKQNPLPGVSLYEVPVHGQLRGRNMLVICNTTGLDGHSLKVVKNIRERLAVDAPEAHVVETMGEALAWIIERLRLTEAAATLLISEESGRLDRQLGEQLQPDPNSYEVLYANLGWYAKRRVDKWVRTAQRWLKNPDNGSFLREPYGKHAPDWHISRVVAAYFRARGYPASVAGLTERILYIAKEGHPG